MQLVNLNKKVPTEREIADVEARLKSMREARESAKRQVIAGIRGVIDDLPDALGSSEIIHLIGLLQGKLKAGHKKVRGNRVPSDLKANLEAALKQDQYTLSQLERMFGLSISYISRVKRDMGLTRHRQEYVDQQLKHQQHKTESVVVA